MAILLSIFIVVLTAVEVLALRVSAIFQKNLELRVLLRSHSRMEDLLRISILGLLVTSATVLIAVYGFKSEGCIADYFNENSICKECRALVHPLCRQCDDRASCNECDTGFYPIDNQCLDCRVKDPLCIDCTSQGCTKCENDMFISRGRCTACSIEGCVPGHCNDKTGCWECEAGYYLDDGQCKLCSSALTGCKQCLNADVCTVCASEFLTVDGGRCICRSGGLNQFTNPDTGACECVDGFYMTDTGCHTCEYLVPMCNSCTVGTTYSGFPIYGVAQFQEAQQYLQCESCDFGRFVQKATKSRPSKCQSCSLQFPGCS